MSNDLATIPAGEMDLLMRQADILAKASLVPQHFRGKPADVLVATLYGREVGFGPVAAMSHIIVINGKPSLSAEGRVALIRKHGHSITGEATPERAVAKGKRADTGDEMSVEWTIDMAKRASLVRKGPWADYPEAMLWARAVSQLSRMLFADVMAGMSYDPEEIESFTQPREVPEERAHQAQIVGEDAVLEIGGERVVDTATGEIVGQVDEPPLPSEPVSSKAQRQMIAMLRTKWRDENGDLIDVSEDDQLHEQEYRLILDRKYGVDSSTKLTKAQASELIEVLSDGEKRAVATTWARRTLADEVAASEAEGGEAA